MKLRYLILVIPLVVSACSSGSSEVAERGLEGRIIYSQGPEGLWEYDLSLGKSSQLWELTDGGFVSGVAVSPDGQEIAVAYAPLTDSPIPRSDIYILNSDGSDPRPLLVHRSLYEAFNHPEWSPDGRWIYFTRSDVLLEDNEGSGTAIVNIERVASGGGEPEVVLEAAEQPSLSGDGEQMAFLRFDLDEFTRSLWIAQSDGSEAIEILPDTAFFDLNSPRLSPSGEDVAFSGSGDLASGDQSSRGFWSKVFGIHPAYAHGLPWDFYVMPSAGGETTKLTDLGTDGAVLDWSPSGDHLAYMHVGGLFVSEDGEPLMLAEAPHHGDVDWTVGPASP